LARKCRSVEDDERAELEAGVESPADGDGQDRLGTGVVERGDVGLVGDGAAQSPVALAVTADVQDVDRAEPALGEPAGPKRVATSRGAAASRPGTA
jgi:hypothetical protein